MTDDVYTYMLDEIQGELLRAKIRMNDIVKHLKNHATPARLATSDAEEIWELIASASRKIDGLPYLGADDD